MSLIWEQQFKEEQNYFSYLGMLSMKPSSEAHSGQKAGDGQ